MILADTIQNQLWYLDSDQQHHMLNLVKAQIDAAYATRTSDKQLADYLLNKLAFQSRQERKNAIWDSKGNNAVAHKIAAEEIDRVHRHCEQEIKSRQEQPLIDEQQFNDVMFESIVKDETDKIVLDHLDNVNGLDAAIGRLNNTLQIIANTQPREAKSNSVLDKLASNKRGFYALSKKR